MDDGWMVAIMGTSVIFMAGIIAWALKAGRKGWIIIPLSTLLLLAGCRSVEAIVASTKSKVVSANTVVDGAEVTTTNAQEADVTPKMRLGHIQHEYTSIPVKPGQPIRIIRRTYSLFFGVLLSEMEVVVWPEKGGLLVVTPEGVRVVDPPSRALSK